MLFCFVSLRDGIVDFTTFWCFTTFLQPDLAPTPRIEDVEAHIHLVTELRLRRDQRESYRNMQAMLFQAWDRSFVPMAECESMDVDGVNLNSSARKNKAKRIPVEVQEEIDCLYEFVPEVEDHFTVIDKIGEGTFSSVFLARLKHHPEVEQLFALKHIIPTSHPSRIEGELKCLLEIGGCDNVIGVELCLRNRDHVVIVMQYFPHEKFHDYLLHMSFKDVHDYMRNLLLALRRVHMFNMIHRDVKPSNFLLDRQTKRYALVDFGLAHKAPVCKNTSQTSTPIADTKKKGILTDSKDDANQDAYTPELPQGHSRQSVSSSEQKPHHYTKTTPSLSNPLFAKRVKSPRRMLLAKRALMVKDKHDDILSQRKSSSSRSYQPSACQCYGKPQICSLCTSRSNQNAPRAGTPGFRSPEVLMKCPDQSTAVDIWSAGVIFLSLLSGRYPFFRANDDLTALAQIISVFGSEATKSAAQACGKNLIASPTQQKVDLQTMCMRLRAAPLSRHQTKKGVKINAAVEQSWKQLPESAFDLLTRLLDLNPYTRITAAEALDHPFFTDSENMSS